MPQHTSIRIAAIDFGNSNTDLVASIDGELRIFHQPHSGLPDAEMTRALLASANIELATLNRITVTGGHHQLLPVQLDGVPITPVNEVLAIGRGGQALAGLDTASSQPLLIVSGGSGVAYIRAQGDAYQHVTGTGVGGGTLLGLAQLLLGTTSPTEIDALAQQGNPNRVDLTLPDAVSGPIGNLPPDTTAVNFGRLMHTDAEYGRADLAAALVTLVGQVVATIAINAARAHGVERIVAIGHLTDMTSVRQAIARTGAFFGQPIETPQPAGHATALGALLSLGDKMPR
ncbi:MAG: hypothetical protein R3A44_02785 [Caldilineaceae bacterium]